MMYFLQTSGVKVNQNCSMLAFSFSRFFGFILFLKNCFRDCSQMTLIVYVLVMLTGIMNAQHLGTVYEAGFAPFIQERFPDRHRLYQDNDPSKYIEKLLKERDVNWPDGSFN